jgi:hypothetical protein
MSFLFTSWIYPLKSPIVLLENPRFALDNARSYEEIQQVASLLRDSYQDQLANFFPPLAEEGVTSLDWMVSAFRKRFGTADSYIEEVLSDHSPETVFESFARIWVLARYDDEGQEEILGRASNDMRKDGQEGFFLLEDDHPIIRNSTELWNYLSLLSVLIHSEDDEYFGRPILISSTDYPGQRRAFDENLWRIAFIMFSIAITSDDEGIRSDKLAWTCFPCVNNRLLDVRDSVSRAFGAGNGELLMYIGNILRVVQHDARDVRVRFLLLISLLELLLTHNPDTTRYNVEDSISRQFNLKTGILVHLQHPNLDLSAIEKRLKRLYSLRSAIAHGNFKEIEKYIQRLNKNAEKEGYFDDVVADAYFYLRAVLEQLLRDAEFVRFIKRS